MATDPHAETMPATGDLAFVQLNGPHAQLIARLAMAIDKLPADVEPSVILAAACAKDDTLGNLEAIVLFVEQRVRPAPITKREPSGHPPR